VHGGAEVSFFKGEGNLDAGWFKGERGRHGPYFDANLGVYVLDAQVSGGGSFLGVKWTHTTGGTVGSAHIGGTAGFTFNSETNMFTLDLSEHVGWKFGQRADLKVEIPAPKFISKKINK